MQHDAEFNNLNLMHFVWENELKNIYVGSLYVAVYKNANKLSKTNRIYIDREACYSVV